MDISSAYSGDLGKSKAMQNLKNHYNKFIIFNDLFNILYKSEGLFLGKNMRKI